MSKTETELHSLAAEINALTPAARLRLAAGLLENKKPDTALVIIERIAGELRLALMLAKTPGR